MSSDSEPICFFQKSDNTSIPKLLRDSSDLVRLRSECDPSLAQYRRQVVLIGRFEGELLNQAGKEEEHLTARHGLPNTLTGTWK